MSIQTILFVGATGALARPVVRQVVAAGYRVKALVRDLEKARQLLPQAVELVSGHLEDVTSIRQAAEGADAVYINLPATTDLGAPFIPEVHGTQNVLRALDRRVLVLKLSEIGASENSDFDDLRLKYRAEQLIQAAGNPYLILRATWFLDSFPYVLTQPGGTILYLGEQPNPIYWLAAKDLGRMVVNALRRPEPVLNRVFTVQGPEPILFGDAARRFIQAYDPALQLINLPLTAEFLPPELAGLQHFVQQVMTYYNNRHEIFESQEVWRLLGEPTLQLEKFVQELKHDQY